MPRGQLRIYLGAAPGVGKTFAALEEAHRRAERGTDVVVGFVETHGRPATAGLVGDLEVVRRRPIEYRGSAFEEFDVDAVIARAPAVALVDELAHTNVPGSRNDKRWQDIDELLDAGIDVISTVNVQHLESLNDVVAQITGVPQRETVPDEVVRRADQVELADITPEALRRRMVHGNVYPPEKVDAALSNYFRVGNLTALREIALLWLADKVEDQLEQYREDQHITATWESKERVVVALSGGDEGDTLIRRAARIAARSGGADLKAVYVASGDGLTSARSARNLARQRNLVEDLGGSYHQVVGDSISEALLEFAQGVNATQLVLGASRRGRFAQMLSRGVGVTTTAQSGKIDVHLVSHERVATVKRTRSGRGVIDSGRRRLGLILALVGIPALVAALEPFHEELSLTTIILIVLTAVMGLTLTGGMWPALLAALIGFFLLNYFFTEPYYHFKVNDQEQFIALVIFVALALGGASVVNVSAARARLAARASAEAQTLATLAGNVLRGGNRLADLLEQLRETFALDSVTLLERTEPGAGPAERHDAKVWRAVACAGEACGSPGAAENDVPINDDLALALRGHTLRAADRRIAQAFAMHAAAALEQERLERQAAAVQRLTDTDKMRTALLAAVSHDLRTPLASVRVAVTSLRSTGELFTPAERAELLESAELSLTRLTGLVDNLLDMSRLQAGVLGANPVPIALDEAVPIALDEIGEAAADVRLDVAPDLPEVAADPGLLQRILVNVIANALRFSPEGRPPRVTAGARGPVVELRVVDRGPGVPDEDRETMFTPFQRLGDRDNTTGVGLGLALSRGLAEAMGGSLNPEATPGGGLTMVLALPRTGAELEEKA
ncbi:sensor histidine kinase [Glycomyces harbinensis]|uniref:histidine kinase n=1 Tax=Glycomyces harbinensis TaxID=58114 RepID=A0A1G6RU80_9ACTN|nr:ATP-binding protein [Glycomyces harbinensis]SDD07944.1 two-component system, OmpR family, sensor histidine kinase KdpD [Glycomyces harbinensis]